MNFLYKTYLKNTLNFQKLKFFLLILILIILICNSIFFSNFFKIDFTIYCEENEINSVVFDKEYFEFIKHKIPRHEAYKSHVKLVEELQSFLNTDNFTVKVTDSEGNFVRLNFLENEVDRSKVLLSMESSKEGINTGEAEIPKEALRKIFKFRYWKWFSSINAYEFYTFSLMNLLVYGSWFTIHTKGLTLILGMHSYYADYEVWEYAAYVMGYLIPLNWTRLAIWFS
jgi:hypothetical protein